MAVRLRASLADFASRPAGERKRFGRFSHDRAGFPRCAGRPPAKPSRHRNNSCSPPLTACRPPRKRTAVAQVAELVDAPASGAGACKGVEVRVLSWAPLFFEDYQPQELSENQRLADTRVIQSGDPYGPIDGAAVQASQDWRLLVSEGGSHGPPRGHWEDRTPEIAPHQGRRRGPEGARENCSPDRIELGLAPGGHPASHD